MRRGLPDRRPEDHIRLFPLRMDAGDVSLVPGVFVRIILVDFVPHALYNVKRKDGMSFRTQTGINLMEGIK